MKYVQTHARSLKKLITVRYEILQIRAWFKMMNISVICIKILHKFAWLLLWVIIDTTRVYTAGISIN